MIKTNLEGIKVKMSSIFALKKPKNLIKDKISKKCSASKIFLGKIIFQEGGNMIVLENIYPWMVKVDMEEQV